MQSSVDCRCIGLLWEFQAPSNGLLRCMRSNLNLEVMVCVGASFLFLYLFTCLFLYLLTSSFLYFYFFALSLCHSFYFSSIFLEPEPKLFPCYVGKQITLTFYFFTWSVMGNQNNIVKFGVPGFFGCSGVPGCSGVFRSVPECFGVPVFWCS